MSIKQPVQVSVYSIKDIMMMAFLDLSFPSLTGESRAFGLSADPFDI